MGDGGWGGAGLSSLFFLFLLRPRLGGAIKWQGISRKLKGDGGWSIDRFQTPVLSAKFRRMGQGGEACLGAIGMEGLVFCLLVGLIFAEMQMGKREQECDGDAQVWVGCV